MLIRVSKSIFFDNINAILCIFFDSSLENFRQHFWSVNCLVFSRVFGFKPVCKNQFFLLRKSTKTETGGS